MSFLDRLSEIRWNLLFMGIGYLLLSSLVPHLRFMVPLASVFLGAAIMLFVRHRR